MGRRKIAAMIIAMTLALGSAALAAVGPSSQPAAAIRMQASPDRTLVSFLGCDTEGGPRADRNLLRPGSGVFVRWRTKQGAFSSATQPAGDVGSSEHPRYLISLAGKAQLAWSIQPAQSFRLAGRGTDWHLLEALDLVFAFDPGVTPTTVLPASWGDDGRLTLPAVISAPDFGQVRIEASSAEPVFGRLEGSRAEKWVELIIELPIRSARESIEVTFRPVHLPAPQGLADEQLWRAARRGWFGALQPTARWGEQGKPFSAPPGALGNNVISDPASLSLWFYADQALFTPEISPGISVMALVRRTVDYWLDARMRPSGGVVGYWAYGDFLDANASLLISAWDVVEACGERPWLERRIAKLEQVAEFLARRDVDSDGLIEATQSGNRGTLQQPNRSCAWWDALNCGHKDAYTNALIYRGFCCLSDLEGRLGRTQQQARYRELARRLKAAYAPALLNPATGWLGWWRSADGELHDYAAPTINGLAIEYGLVPPEQGREILARLRRKMAEVGFNRFDLGVPPMLVPVLRADYLLPDAIGIPKREDGADTVGQYMNGGITAGHVLHFLAAHYVVGEPEPADRILRAMLERQQGGGFQNGVRDAAGQGIDWTTWDGRPSGYEGYLADSFRFLQAVLLREQAFRDRLYRPLLK